MRLIISKRLISTLYTILKTIRSRSKHSSFTRKTREFIFANGSWVALGLLVTAVAYANINPHITHIQATQRLNQTLGGPEGQAPSLEANITQSTSSQTVGVLRGQDASVKTKKDSSQIRTYTVKKTEDGTVESVADIADKFGVSKNTIIVANELKDPDSIEAGDELTILPTDGVVVSPNQDINLKEIAQKYNVESPQKILEYNDLTKEQLASSEQIIVPTTDIPYSELPHKEARPVNIASGPSAQDVPSGNITHDRMGNGFYEYPAAGSVNPHWQAHKRGVDIDGNYGSPIKAAAPGKVEIAGWHNAGYGYYVVIRHADGSRTLYAHMATNSLTVSEGDHVDRGTVLGQMGNTGYSTGPHLHFEIRP